MADRKIFEEWLIRAEEDFDFASSSMVNSFSFFGQICFHFQQSAEKHLKAYIVAFDLEFKKIHELPELLEICGRHNPVFYDLKGDCIFLTDFYVVTRYPVPWPAKISRFDVETARESAKKIGKLVKTFLKR